MKSWSRKVSGVEAYYPIRASIIIRNAWFGARDWYMWSVHAYLTTCLATFVSESEICVSDGIASSIIDLLGKAPLSSEDSNKFSEGCMEIMLPGTIQSIKVPFVSGKVVNYAKPKSRENVLVFSIKAEGKSIVYSRFPRITIHKPHTRPRHRPKVRPIAPRKVL